jgi:undecaprenyl-diphosphatase
MPIWFAILILGIVEGLTEFLPVSSTGHLLLAEKFLHARQSDLFNIVIQSGAVLAVLPLFKERLSQFIFRWRERAVQEYAAKIAVAFAITAVGGFVLEKKGFKLPEEMKPVAIALLVGGIGFVLVERWLRGRALRDLITWDIAIVVGAGQLLAAVFPGTSRSGATILFSLLLGVARPAATEFSFLVGIPTMLAAGGHKILKEMHHHDALAPKEDWGMILLATVVAAAVSFVTVKWLLVYVRSHTFTAFGWYRIALGAGILIFAALH